MRKILTIGMCLGILGCSMVYPRITCSPSIGYGYNNLTPTDYHNLYPSVGCKF